MRAIIVAAFVNNDVQKGFPAEQCPLAVWAEIFGFKRSFKTIIDLKIRRADFATQLALGFAVVVIQVSVRGVAEGAMFFIGDVGDAAVIDGLERSAVFGLIGFKQCFEV